MVWCVWRCGDAGNMSGLARRLPRGNDLTRLGSFGGRLVRLRGGRVRSSQSGEIGSEVALGKRAVRGRRPPCGNGVARREIVPTVIVSLMRSGDFGGAVADAFTARKQKFPDASFGLGRGRRHGRRRKERGHQDGDEHGETLEPGHVFSFSRPAIRLARGTTPASSKEQLGRKKCPVLRSVQSLGPRRRRAPHIEWTITRSRSASTAKYTPYWVFGSIQRRIVWPLR